MCASVLGPVKSEFLHRCSHVNTIRMKIGHKIWVWCQIDCDILCEIIQTEKFTSEYGSSMEAIKGHDFEHI